MKTETAVYNPKVFDLKERTTIFSLGIINFLESLSSDYISRVIGQQLLRSPTSIGANIIEAQAASSRKEFSNFYSIALKSANETKYWLFLLKKSNKGDSEKIVLLERETDELSKIIAKCILSIKNN